MRVSLSHFSKVISVLALTLALALIGFAHRGPVSNDATARAFDPTYLAFVAAGGTAQDLCADHAAEQPGSGHSDHGAPNACEACRLFDTAILPAAEQTATPWHAPRSAALWPARAETLTPATAHRLAQVRAPPRA